MPPKPLQGVVLDQAHECPRCKGRRVVYTDDRLLTECPTCGGEGWVR